MLATTQSRLATLTSRPVGASSLDEKALHAIFHQSRRRRLAMKRLAMLAIMLLAAAPAPAQPVPDTTQSAPAASRVDARVAQMHRVLKITPEQEPAWNAFAAVMRDNATSTYEAFGQRRASVATMSAVDNLKNFAQIEQARAQGVQNLAYSFETLYGTFSDEQKKIADTMFRRHQDLGEVPKRAPKKPG
jgi:protein CpxP